MIISLITKDNLDLIPKTMNLNIIGNVELSFVDNVFKYTVNYLESEKGFSFPTSKPNDISELSENRFGFICTENGRYVAHVIAESKFNSTLYIEDFDVHSDYREKKCAEMLMDYVVDYATSRYKGISLEVQNTNAIAFLFYLKYGFEIGGFDRSVYKNTPQNGEVAIYLYKYF